MQRALLVIGLVAVCAPAAARAQGGHTAGGRITVIYDAFGAASRLQRDWGFAALIEYGGRRILFDTGNNASIFEKNVDLLGIDLGRLDAAVISHRHGDHTTGLSVLVRRNPAVTIYTPPEGAFFKSTVPPGFLTPEPDLPPSLRYFDGKPPDGLPSGTPWEGARFETVADSQEILPGIFALTMRSQKPGTIDMNELSLAIRTPTGLVVVVGCAHPGVEKILERASKLDARLHLVTGGFHLVMAPADEVSRVAAVLHDGLKVQRVAPGHCTSELGFKLFLQRFGDRFERAGVGAAIALP